MVLHLSFLWFPSGRNPHSLSHLDSAANLATGKIKWECNHFLLKSVPLQKFLSTKSKANKHCQTTLFINLKYSVHRFTPVCLSRICYFIAQLYLRGTSASRDFVIATFHLHFLSRDHNRLTERSFYGILFPSRQFRAFSVVFVSLSLPHFQTSAFNRVTIRAMFN